MTHCRSFWGGGGTTFVIRNGHFWNQANGGYAPFISNAAPDFAPDLKNFLPASAQYDSGEGGAGKPGTTAIYGGHSHVGTMIYLGDNWPDIYRDHLFTNNLFGRQMNQQENVRAGSGYETFHAGYDLMFTPDPTLHGDRSANRPRRRGLCDRLVRHAALPHAGGGEDRPHQWPHLPGLLGGDLSPGESGSWRKERR